MMDEYFAVPISPTNKRARAQMDALLEREGIERDRNLTYSAAIYDDDGQMIATGSLFENTLRCLAVDGAHRGEGLMAVIVAHLVQAQLERGNTHLFLYTKIDSAKFFARRTSASSSMTDRLKPFGRLCRKRRMPI